MTRRYAWVFNLDAEFELTRRGYNTPALLRNQLARHGEQVARALMGPHDALLKDAVPGEFLGRAWCPTAHALAAMHAAHVTPEPHPSVDVVRRVNHRRFAHELGGGLTGQRYVESATQLEAALGEDGVWLLKRPLAFAGRGQQRITGPLTPQQQTWIEASLRNEGLIVEPLITPSLEVSVHGFIWRDGRHQLGRLCQQQVDSQGVFRGVSLAANDALTARERTTLFDTAERVARALFHAGYFGPFGIDSYRHQNGFCALSEINARYTMAFAIGFPTPAHQLEL